MIDALVLTILGMGTVIIVLYIISLMIRLMGKVVGSGLTSAPKPAAPKADAVASEKPKAAPEADDAQLIAVLAAAADVYLSGKRI